MNTRELLIVAVLCIGVFGTIALITKSKKPLDPSIFNDQIDTPEKFIEEPPVEPPDPVESGLASITKKELKDDLYYLSSDKLEGRMSGKKGNVTAAAFIKSEFENMGLKTMYHRFPIRRTNNGPNNEIGDDFSQNIYGWIEGNDPSLKDEIVVVGAHMDGVGYGPDFSRSRRIDIHNGADDNASGVVALLEIAEAFSLFKDQVKRTIVFQAYSAEEMGLIGSRHYCNNPTFPQNKPDIKKHIAMINLDMIGWLNKGTLHALNTGNSSPDIARIIRDLSDSKYPFAEQITSRGTGGSDHAPFYNRRIPVAFLHTGLHRYYHTISDTADKINYDNLESITKYAFELSWKITQSDNRPQFNHDSFEAMNYETGHGHSKDEEPIMNEEPIIDEDKDSYKSILERK